MNKIINFWNTLNFNAKLNIVYTFIVLTLIVMIMFFSNQAHSLKEKLTISEANVAALKDTTRVIRMKNGELETVKLALLADKKTLKELSEKLADEVKKESGKVKYITSAGATIKITDTLYAHNTVVDSTIFWVYQRSDSSGSRRLAGITTPSVTKITRDEIGLTLITGIKERSDKKMEIFIRSKYPGITFTNIEGAIIDPTRPILPTPVKRFGIGPCAAATIDYAGKVHVGVGISLQWSIFKF